MSDDERVAFGLGVIEGIVLSSSMLWFAIWCEDSKWNREYNSGTRGGVMNQEIRK